MYPVWDSIARNLYLQKIYKETWGIKRNEYPYYGDVLSKGAQYGIYDKEVVESFTEEEIRELNDYIKPERDFLLSYLGLRVFMDKYSMHYTQTKNLELPQHGFMRLALYAFWKEDKSERIELIKNRYDHMSRLLYSEATPKWLNSLTPNAQMASCVVTKIPDDSWGINKTMSNLGLFSKYGGGLATDVSSLRATGSKIRKAGESSGPIPFIRMIESVVSAYNQLGKRNGACAVYFPWWHFDAPEMIELKKRVEQKIDEPVSCNMV
jgi:ribonucleoside-diphosphate reductase alpha chain